MLLLVIITFIIIIIIVIIIESYTDRRETLVDLYTPTLPSVVMEGRLKTTSYH